MIPGVFTTRGLPPSPSPPPASGRGKERSPASRRGEPSRRSLASPAGGRGAAPPTGGDAERVAPPGNVHQIQTERREPTGFHPPPHPLPPAGGEREEPRQPEGGTISQVSCLSRRRERRGAANRRRRGEGGPTRQRAPDPNRKTRTRGLPPSPSPPPASRRGKERSPASRRGEPSRRSLASPAGGRGAAPPTGGDAERVAPPGNVHQIQTERREPAGFHPPPHPLPPAGGGKRGAPHGAGLLAWSG